LRKFIDVIVFKNAFWLSICRFVADFSSLILFTAISRELGPESTGQYSYAFALGAFIAILAASGLDQYGVREYVRLSAGSERTSLWRAMLLVQGLQLLCGVCVLVLGIFFLANGHANPIVVVELSVFLIGWGLSRTAFIPAMAKESMTAPALIELLCRSAANLSALILCLTGVSSLPTMLAGFPLAGLVLLGLSLRNAARHGEGFRISGARTRAAKVARGTLPFTVCEALGQFYIRADLLLVTHMLGAASAGWYAADLKVVEVGVMPLILLGTAAFPLLSRTASIDRRGFARIAEDFLRSALFVSGWLAVGIFSLVPHVIPAIFGDRFAPAARLLPMFAVLAIVKGFEITIYRLLYATQKQTTYLIALAGGTTLIVFFNLMLIPHFGTGGAILAVVMSTAVVDSVGIITLRRHLPLRAFALTILRLGLPLGCTFGTYVGLRASGLNDWFVAGGACLAFPLFSIVSGLIPNPRRSPLFAHEASVRPLNA
jgi:O-antigen/teichoic acid export membrane protein